MTRCLFVLLAFVPLVVACSSSSIAVRPDGDLMIYEKGSIYICQQPDFETCKKKGNPNLK